jgi:phosphoglycolate phosphatase
VKGLVIFDFDGTIVDSLEICVESANLIAKDFGYQPVSLAEANALRGFSSREIIHLMGIPTWKLLFFLRRFRREVGRQVDQLQPVEGIQEMLVHLLEQGYTLGIVTANSRQNVERFLHFHGLDKLFEFIDGGKVIAGKTRALQRLARVHRKTSSPRNLFFIGDEIIDVEAAQAAGFNSIAVSWGFNTRAALAQAGPDALVDKPEELLVAINKLLVRQA